MAQKESIRVRPGRQLDRFNDPVGEPGDWRTIPGATVVPRSSQEQEKRGTVIIAGFMIALPGVVYDTLSQLVELDENHEIEVRGQIHQIEGAIGRYGRKMIFYVMRAS